MISWIVASNDEATLKAHLLSTLKADGGDELVVIRDAPSITMAYAAGQARASQPVRCYIHHDVEIRDLPRLRGELIEHTVGRGIVGVVGSTDAVMPWWNGNRLGSVVDTRMGLLDFGPGGECAMLDGLLLATRQRVDWDVDAPGWHGYDQDACSQMLARGLRNYCLTGASYVEHHARAGKDRSDGYDEAVERWRKRWAA